MLDDFDMDDDASSNADSAISDSTALSGSLADSPFLHLNIPYSFEGLDAGMDEAQPTQVKSREESVDQYNAGNIGLKTAEYKTEKKGTNTALYKCGYCLFSARLRTMVKMHCQKQHPYRKVHCIEPKLRISRLGNAVSDNKYDSIVSDDQHSSDTKVSSFDITKPDQSSLQLQQKELDISKIVPVLQHPKLAPKKSKSLKSVIDQLSSKAKQKGDGDINANSNSESDNFKYEPNDSGVAFIKNDSTSTKSDGAHADCNDDISLCAKNDNGSISYKVNTSTYDKSDNDLSIETEIDGDTMPITKHDSAANTHADRDDSTGANQHDNNVNTCIKNPIDINPCSHGDSDINEFAKPQVDAASVNNHVNRDYTIQQSDEQSTDQEPSVSERTHKYDKAMQEQIPATGNVQESEISPPVLTNQLCEDDNIVEVAEMKEDDINPPLLINEAEKIADEVTVRPLECETLADTEVSALEVTSVKTGDNFVGSVSVQKGENQSGNISKVESSKYSSSQITENYDELTTDNHVEESPFNTQEPDSFSLQDVSDRIVQNTNAQSVNKSETTNALNGFVDSTVSSVSTEGSPENGYSDSKEDNSLTASTAGVYTLKTRVLNAGSCLENGSINKGIVDEDNKLNAAVVSQSNACEKDTSTD